MSGATTTQGTGPGAAHGGIKGPGNGRNFWVPSINPHVVAAGTVTLASGAATVTFPNALTGSESGYVVMLTAESANNVGISGKTDDTASGNFESFDVTGTSTDDVMWMVIKAGWGLEA